MNTWYWLAINGASCAMASFPLPMTHGWMGRMGCDEESEGES